MVSTHLEEIHQIGSILQAKVKIIKTPILKPRPGHSKLTIIERHMIFDRPSQGLSCPNPLRFKKTQVIGDIIQDNVSDAKWGWLRPAKKHLFFFHQTCFRKDLTCFRKFFFLPPIHQQSSSSYRSSICVSCLGSLNNLDSFNSKSSLLI